MLTREQRVHLRVGQTVTTKVFRHPARITKITVVADGERVIQLDHQGIGNRTFTTWIGESQIEDVVSA